MWKVLAIINKNLVIAIPMTMLLGFMTGILADTAALKALITPFTFLMVYPMMITLKVKKVFHGGDMRAQIATQVINFCLIPFLTYAIGKIFFADAPYMILGLLLAGLVPTSGMTISWTGFAKGNVESAVKMTIIGLTLGSLATPFYLQYLLGAAISIDISGITSQILYIVFLPMLLGYITQQLFLKRYGQKVFQEQLAPKFPGLSSIGVLAIVFIAIALKARSIAQAPDMLLGILVPVITLYALNFLISTYIGRLLLPRGDAIALVYGTVMRNLSIALALAMNVFHEAGTEAALIIAIAYIVQVQSAAWYVKMTDKLFGMHTDPGSIKKC